MGKKKKNRKVDEKIKGSESYSSFDEYLDFDVAVSTLQDCCHSLLPMIRSQLDETSINKKALRELVIMLDYVVSEAKKRIMYLTQQMRSNKDEEIKREAQARLNDTICRIKQVLELKRPYDYDDDDYWDDIRRQEEEEEDRRRREEEEDEDRRREDEDRRREDEEEEERHREYMGWDE